MTKTVASFVIAIDGPSGSGKGTLARKLGEFYDFPVLDTGLLYRAVASKMLAMKWDLDSQDLAVQEAESLTQDDLNNPKNREDTVAIAASRIAAFPKVRDVLNQYQRDFASNPPEGKKGAILDGRDIGTTICPTAPVKLYLIAKDEIRAKRRFEELQFRGIEGIYADVLNDIRARDQRDQARQTSPLRPAEDAVVVDTTSLSSRDVFLKAQNIIESSPAFKDRHSA